jgi:Xaa-Pro aminopeptidase
MDKSIHANRIGKLRTVMTKNKLDALILINSKNIAYMTGFTGEDAWAMITNRSSYLFTDGRYIEQSHSQCPHCSIVQRKKTMTDAVAKKIAALRSVKNAAIENNCSIDIFNRLKKKLKVKLKAVPDYLEQFRSVKDVDEIAAVRLASRIAYTALNRTLLNLKTGITENEAAGLLNYNLRQLGSRNTFETIFAFGPNASKPHHEPSPTKLMKNDTILIDFGAEAKGYTCDITRCFVVGDKAKIPSGYEKTWHAVYQAQKAAIEMIKPDQKNKNVDSAARKVIKDAKLPDFGHGTGHGLGLNVHESPTLSQMSKQTLKTGNIITVEPGCYIPKKLGIRIEDDVLVTEQGPEILSTDNRFGFSTDKMPILKINK